MLTSCFFVLFVFGENRQPLCLLCKRTSLGSVLDLAPCLEESLRVWQSLDLRKSRRVLLSTLNV